MGSPFPRPLSEHERALLDLLLAEEFPGVGPLRVHAESVRVSGLYGATVVLFEVADPDAPLAEVVHPVPVETRVRGANPPEELLLFVKNGLLDSIELVTYGDETPTELLDVAALERPWTKPIGWA